MFHQANLVAAIVLGLVERLVGHLDENPEGLSAAARHQGADADADGQVRARAWLVVADLQALHRTPDLFRQQPRAARRGARQDHGELPP